MNTPERHRSAFEGCDDVALRTVNVLGICAGVGGLELGLRLAHWHRGQDIRGVCYVEREAAAAASLVASMEAGWFHPAPVWSDARTFDGRPFAGLVDVVTSGDPCQGNSVAGKRLGELDDRWLLDRAIDIFDQSGAPRFFRENVPGNADGQLAVAIPALERLGCRVAVGIFSSAETGNTMRRERLFILAEREDQRHERGRRARRRGHGFANGGGEMAISDGGRGRHGRLQRCGEQRLLAQCDGDGGQSAQELGGTSGPEPQGQLGGQHHAGGRQVKSRYPALSGGAILPPAVIPGPFDTRGWIDVIDRWPELQPALSEEEAQSHLRRGIDAMANRIERIRATGNGVDPVAAATAWLSLDALLAAETGGSGHVAVSAAA